MKIKIIIILIISAIYFINSADNKKSNTLNVRIAAFPNITHAQAMLGKSTGSFEKAFGKDVKIEWKIFNAGPSEIEAFFAGALDIGYIGPVPAINGFVKSRGDIVIISGASSGGAVFVSRKGLIINNLKELSGKKIGVPQFGNTQDFILRDILLKTGLKDTVKGGTVEIHQAESADIKTLFENGGLDAALVAEPWGSRLVKETGANIILDYNKVFLNGKYSTAVIIVSKDFLKKHPVEVEIFLKTHLELTDFINKNTDQAKKLINKEIEEITKKSLPEDILDNSFKKVTFTADPESNSIFEYINIMTELGLLKSKPDVKNIINLDILNKIRRKN